MKPFGGGLQHLSATDAQAHEREVKPKETRNRSMKTGKETRSFSFLFSFFFLFFFGNKTHYQSYHCLEKDNRDLLDIHCAPLAFWKKSKFKRFERTWKRGYFLLVQ